VFVETTEKAFLFQTTLAYVFLPQQIARHGPHRSHMFGGMGLPETAAIFIERDISRPMERILEIPRLPNHGAAGGGSPQYPGTGEAVVTGDRRVLVRHPHRCHGNDRLETRPWRELRPSCPGGHGPHPAADWAATRVIQGIKEMLGVPLAGEYFEEGWHGGNCLRCRLGFNLSHDEAAVSRTPGREPRSWSTCRSPLKGRFDGCPSEREEGAVGALGDGPGPGPQAFLKTLGLEDGQPPGRR
jgi:hypothetical protein